jgi:hypothetical protein
MTTIQQLLDYIEHLKRLDTGTLEGWLTEHMVLAIWVCFALIVLTILLEKE